MIKTLLVLNMEEFKDCKVLNWRNKYASIKSYAPTGFRVFRQLQLLTILIVDTSQTPLLAHKGNVNERFWEKW